MEKKNGKKVNWKKVAITAGVFTAGIAIGVISGEKILNYISWNDICDIEVKVFKKNGNTLFRYTITSPETGRKLSTVCPKDFMKPIMKLAEGPVSDSELMDLIFH